MNNQQVTALNSLIITFFNFIFYFYFLTLGCQEKDNRQKVAAGTKRQSRWEYQ